MDIQENTPYILSVFDYDGNREEYIEVSGLTPHYNLYGYYYVNPDMLTDDLKVDIKTPFCVDAEELPWGFSQFLIGFLGQDIENKYLLFGHDLENGKPLPSPLDNVSVVVGIEEDFEPYEEVFYADDMLLVECDETYYSEEDFPDILVQLDEHNGGYIDRYLADYLDEVWAWEHWDGSNWETYYVEDNGAYQVEDTRESFMEGWEDLGRVRERDGHKDYYRAKDGKIWVEDVSYWQGSTDKYYTIDEEDLPEEL